MTPNPTESEVVLAKLADQKWWQGSLIHSTYISDVVSNHPECQWWVIASQTCNIYSGDFTAIPALELIGALEVDKLDRITNGSHPRQIELPAHSDARQIFLRIDALKRVWLPRHYLACISAPEFYLRNIPTQPASNRSYWLDKFTDWLSRGYTRVALPDKFNEILSKSKIRSVIEEKLARKNHDDVFGIFFTITSTDDQQDNEIGSLTPPYDLGILIACHQDSDLDTIRNQLLKQLFIDKVLDPRSGSEIPRSALAKNMGLRLMEDDVEVRSISDITLNEILGKNTVRYNIVDFHSSSNSNPI